MNWRRIAIVSVSVAALSGPLWSVEAAMLEPDVCDGLKAEQEKIGGKRLRDAMEKGPEWAKANLASSEINVVRRFIELEEQVLFRCPRPKPVKAAQPPGEKAPAGEQAAGKAAPKSQTKSQTKSDTKSETKSETKAQPKTEGTTKPAPKPIPKPKHNDAFVPPPKKPAD